MSAVTIGSVARAVLVVCVATAAVAGREAPAVPKTLEGLEFRSVDKLEGGPTPMGVSRVHWTVRFKAGEFHWQYTDVVVVGSYSWDAKAGKVEGKGLGATGKTHTGTFDVKTKTLTWEGKKYALVERAKPAEKK